MTGSLLTRDDDAPALVDAAAGTTLSHRGLRDAVARAMADHGEAAGRLVLLGISPTIPSVVEYLAWAAGGATVALVDPASPSERLAAWVDAYRPDVVGGCAAAPPLPPPGPAMGAPAADRVLLPTSGTTGSPKFVRLSEANLMANAAQIAEALRLTPDDRAAAYLPFHYSYGLSVLHSHLLVGAAVVLVTEALTRPGFEATLAAQRVTTLPGVPFSFDVWERTRLLEHDLPALREVTVAGGKLATPAVLAVSERLRARGGRLWTMYGQTEATARIAVLPPEELPACAGSVGRPVPGTVLRIDDPDDQGVGEIVVAGPQVMLGYARSRDDVGTGDTTGGEHATGDLGRLDAEGRLWVRGRRSRMTKVYGARVSLDDLEAALAPVGVVAALDGGDHVLAVMEGPGDAAPPARRLEQAAGLPVGCVEVVVVTRAPRTAAGKIDHTALAHDLSPAAALR